MTNFKFVELFAGIGGFHQALREIGGECVMASEWDKFASQSYSILYGGENLHGDVTKINENDVPDHDLLVFGMPCQAFSVAGKRLGFEDMRGTLYFEAMRIAKAKKPKALWMENVKGLISHDKGRTLEVMAQAMSDLGYTIDFEVMNSKYFGVPQNRERIFMIGVRNDLVTTQSWELGKRKDVVAKGKRRISEMGVSTFNFDWPAQEEVTVRLRDILERDVDEKFYLSEEKTAKLVAQLDERVEGLAIREATKKGYVIAQEGDAVNFQFPDSESRRGRLGKEIANTLEASNINQGVVEPVMLGHIDLKGHDAIKRVYSAEGVSPTLTTMGGGHREPKIAEEHLESKYRIRKLTPRECFRLQGFPDSEFDKLSANGSDGRQLVSNSQLYKQAGNAVTVNVIDALGRRLLDYVNKEAN